jgi:hypothetical protein
MKKLLVALAVAGITFATLAQTVVTNRGEVIEVTTFADMQTATDKGLDTFVSYPPHVILSDSTNLTLAAAQQYTGVPGQLLVSIATSSSSNIVYINTQGGTNWVLLK